MAKKQPPVTLKIEGSWEDAAAKLLTVPAGSTPNRKTDKRKKVAKKALKSASPQPSSTGVAAVPNGYVNLGPIGGRARQCPNCGNSVVFRTLRKKSDKATYWQCPLKKCGKRIPAPAADPTK